MPSSLQSETLTVLGLDITFRPGADMERARQAAQFVEKRFSDQKGRSRGSQGKEILLTFIALGLADELLQMKIAQEQERKRLESLLEKIDTILITG